MSADLTPYLGGGDLVRDAQHTDRRRLAGMTKRLLAEQRIEAATRATLSAMREALRRAKR